MRASGPALVCALLIVASCGEDEPTRPHGSAPREPALRAGMEPADTGTDGVTNTEDGEIRPSASVEGQLTPIQLRDRAVPGDRRLWNLDFLDFVYGKEIYVADAVAPRFASRPKGPWNFKVVRSLGAPPRQQPGETLTVLAPEEATIESGERWVLLGNWHKPGFNVIACWEHSEAVETAIGYLRGTLAALRDGARAWDREHWGRSFARDFHEWGIWLCRTVGPDTSAPERGPDRWLFQVEEVLQGHARPGRSSCRMSPAQAMELEADAPVILVVNHQSRAVQGWWPRAPEILAAIRMLVAIPRR